MVPLAWRLKMLPLWLECLGLNPGCVAMNKLLILSEPVLSSKVKIGYFKEYLELNKAFSTDAYICLYWFSSNVV